MRTLLIEDMERLIAKFDNKVDAFFAVAEYRLCNELRYDDCPSCNSDKFKFVLATPLAFKTQCDHFICLDCGYHDTRDSDKSD